MSLYISAGKKLSSSNLDVDLIQLICLFSLSFFMVISIIFSTFQHFSTFHFLIHELKNISIM